MTAHSPQAIGMTKEDFDQILGSLEEFWGEKNETILAQHSLILYHEFGDTAFVIRNGDVVIAYLMGFYSQTDFLGYVHLIAVRKGHRRKGYAHLLYAHFEDLVRTSGRKGLKAVAMPRNQVSIDFHRSIGMEPVEGGVVENYRGPGKDRVVLEKRW